MIRALLLTLALAACGTVAPDKFTVEGREFVTYAERNAPRETAVRPGVEMIVYDVSFAEVQEACGTGHDTGGCSILFGSLCAVYLIDPKLIDAKAYRLLARHELHHCNGYTHTLTRTETGWVYDWQSGE